MVKFIYVYKLVRSLLVVVRKFLFVTCLSSNTLNVTGRTTTKEKLVKRKRKNDYIPDSTEDDGDEDYIPPSPKG